jgi:hypothetical protein
LKKYEKMFNNLRSPSKLKDFRRKQAAKTSITRFKKEQRKMEGGPGPLEREILILIGQFIMFAPSTLKKTCLRLILTILEFFFFLFFLISLDIHKVVILPFFIASIENFAGFTLLLRLYQAF